jgi:RNA polymerase sigma-70 factor (ECF subfamily)
MLWSLAASRPGPGGLPAAGATSGAAVVARGPRPSREEASTDEAGFRAFYEATARPLWAYLVRSCGDRALADDLVQESYYRLLRSRFAGEGAEHRKNYLFRIATNLVRDHFRRRRPEEPAAEGSEPAAAETGGPLGLRQDLARVLDRLDPRERQLVWLAHVEGASHREIGELLRVEEGSVRVLLFRARRKLAGLLREAGLAPDGPERGPSAGGRDRNLEVTR